MSYIEIVRNLDLLIQSGKIDSAVEYVSVPKSIFDGEYYVTAALENERCAVAVIGAAIEGFIKTLNDCNHSAWVHSFSHFAPKLWRLGFKEWIRHLNEIAFEGALRLGAHKYSIKLLEYFSEYATWDTVPREYGFSQRNLRWVDQSDPRLAFYIARIRSSPFESQIEFIRFCLRFPILFTKDSAHTEEFGTHLIVDVEKVKESVALLNVLGDDTSDLNGIEKSIIQKFIEMIEADRVAAPSGWYRDNFLSHVIGLSKDMIQDPFEKKDHYVGS